MGDRQTTTKEIMVRVDNNVLVRPFEVYRVVDRRTCLLAS